VPAEAICFRVVRPCRCPCVHASVIHVVVLCFHDISSICWRIFAKLLSLVHFGTQMTWLRFWVKRSKFKVTQHTLPSSATFSSWWHCWKRDSVYCDTYCCSVFSVRMHSQWKLLTLWGRQCIWPTHFWGLLFQLRPYILLFYGNMFLLFYYDTSSTCTLFSQNAIQKPQSAHRYGCVFVFIFLPWITLLLMLVLFSLLLFASLCMSRISLCRFKNIQ